MNSAIRRTLAARFILREADLAGVCVGTNGCDLIIAPAPGMSSTSYLSFQQAIIAHGDEIIDLILQKGRR